MDRRAHGLSAAPTLEETVDRYPRQVWRNAAGEDLIEAYTIPRMPHGTPVAAGEADDQCGTAGAFLLEVGISSSYHIAKFWGLADRPRTAAVKQREPIEIASDQHPHVANKERIEEARDAGAEPASVPRSTSIDLHAVITDALKAAGLMKGRSSP